MKSKNLVAVMMLALVALMFGGFVSSASAAPTSGMDGGIFNGTTLGGSISGQDGYPYLYSNGAVYGDTVTGNFSIQLDASRVSLSGANWSFFANNWDPSRWTAICYMYGYRNNHEEYPQSQSWYQQVSPIGGPSINASLAFNCYEFPSDGDIVNLQVQCLQIQLYLMTAPEDQKDQLNAQLAAMQAQLAYLQQQPREQTLEIYGNVNVEPSKLDDSSFSYTEYEQEVSYWDPALGSDGGWNSKFVPVWQAEFRLHGQFVPEPATMSLLALGMMGFIARRKRS